MVAKCFEMSLESSSQTMDFAILKLSTFFSLSFL